MMIKKDFKLNYRNNGIPCCSSCKFKYWDRNTYCNYDDSYLLLTNISSMHEWASTHIVCADGLCDNYKPYIVGKK